jgi:hypothetical protein
MADTKERTISYRRADWLIDNPDSISLSSMLKQAAGKLKSVEDRSLYRHGQVMRLVNLRASKEGFLAHITLETPGEAASVVPKVDKSVEEADVETTAPPEGKEFMDGDAFLFVKEDHVCLCMTGMMDVTVRNFLQDFFMKAKIRRDADKFDLIKVADISKVKLLQSQGVKEIELRAALFAASAQYHKRRAHPQGFLGAVAKQTMSLLGNEHDVNFDALKVMLTLKVDERRRGLVLGEKRMKQLGTDLLRNQQPGDDFTIVTKTGQRIGPQEIFMRSTAQIEALGKSVERTPAWRELVRFYEALRTSGALEE